MQKVPFRSSHWLMGALAVTLVAGAGCKKKVPPPPPTEQVPVQKVESKLQITTITPGSFEEGTGGTAKIYGSAFESGASVKVGDTPLKRVELVDPNTLDVTLPGMAAGTYDVAVTNPDGSSAMLRSGLVVRAAKVVEDCSRMTLYFGFDSAGVTPEARRALDGKMACYQRKSGQVRLEGHADERGTTDYNLALGQRRAEAVANHLAGQGVSRSRLKAVSYGEERPAVRGSSESAWAKNRRVEVAAD